MHTYAYICIHVYTRSYLCIHVHLCGYMWIHLHTRAYKFIHVQTCAYMCISLDPRRINVPTCAYLCKHVHTQCIHLHNNNIERHCTIHTVQVWYGVVLKRMVQALDSRMAVHYNARSTVRICIVLYSTLGCGTLQGSILVCSARQGWGTLQCSTLGCSTLQCCIIGCNPEFLYFVPLYETIE